MEESPSLPPDTVTPDPGRAQACWRYSQQHLTCFSARKKKKWHETHFIFFFISLSGRATHLHRFKDLWQFHTSPEENTFGIQFIFLVPANPSCLAVFSKTLIWHVITAVSYLEKASFSTSSPGSTQRCRAVEKCPQATAISATSYNKDQTWLTDY